MTEKPSTVLQGSSLWKDARSRMAKNKFAMGGFWVIVVMFSLCFILAWSCKDPNQVNLTNKFAPSSAEHWFGTDALGRDLFARILYGGQVSILVGLIATAVSVAIGIVYGSISGFAGGRTDAVMMRVVDTLLAIPFLGLGYRSASNPERLVRAMPTRWIVENFKWDKEFTGRLTNIVPLFFALGLLGLAHPFTNCTSTR
jgi:oligopeptide transport system permease protein